jgi:steroid delta-isomerase-like uncharacterized protein
LTLHEVKSVALSKKETAVLVRQVTCVPLVAFLLLAPSLTYSGEQEETNKGITHRYAEELWNQGKASLIAELVAVDIVLHGAGFPDMKGQEAFSNSFSLFRRAFPDFHVTIDDMVAEGDKVAFRWTESGTHQGEYAGIAATGKHVTWTGMSVYRIAKGQIAEMWVSMDDLGLLRQLGAIPQ